MRNFKRNIYRLGEEAAVSYYCPLFSEFSPALDSSINMDLIYPNTWGSDAITYTGSVPTVVVLRWYASGQSSYPGAVDYVDPLYENAYTTTLHLVPGNSFTLTAGGINSAETDITVNAKDFLCNPTTTTTTTTSTTTTTTTTSAFETFTLSYSNSSGSAACADFPAITGTYYGGPGSMIGVGTILYTTSALITPVANGYYSDGVNYYNTVGGDGTLQNEVACTPPTTTTTTTTTTSTTTTTTTTAAPIPTFTYLVEGIWEVDDPAHPAGGNITYVDSTGATVTESGLWNTDSFEIVVRSIGSHVGVSLTLIP